MLPSWLMDIAGQLVFIVRRIAELDRKLDRIESEIISNQRILMTTQADYKAALDELTAQVAAEETVGDSMMTLMQGLGDQLRQQANDPAAIATLAASLKTKAAAWSAAVTQNTAASPAPAPVPVTTDPVEPPPEVAPPAEADPVAETPPTDVPPPNA